MLQTSNISYNKCWGRESNVSIWWILKLPRSCRLNFIRTLLPSYRRGTGTWRLVYSGPTQQYGVFQFTLPFDYSGSQAVQLIFSSASSLSVAKSIQWIVDHGYGNSQNSVYMILFLVKFNYHCSFSRIFSWSNSNNNVPLATC